MDVVQPAVVMSSPSGPTPPDAPARPIRAAHRLEYLVVRAAAAAARVVPLRWVTATGAGLVGLIGPMLRQNRRALANLEVAFPEKSQAERRRIARAMWANMGRIFAETLVLDRIVADPGRITIVDRAEWQRRMGEPGSSIGCTLHMGNWELAIWPLTLFGRAPVGVYKPLDNPLLDRWLADTRRALYPSGLLGKGESEDDPRAGQRTARALIDIARKGGAIGFVSDHFDRRGEPIRFMGRQARFTTAPAMIARHVGARVWVGRCKRIGKGSRFEIELKELAVLRSSDKAADSRALTTAIFAQFEDWIREAPEQWMWWNTRWLKPDAAPAPEGACASAVNAEPAPGAAS
jgi:Kdo2-lipid IVA lauroyltransferase/acyltransferase